MNDFDYDVMTKKRIARGSFANVRYKRGGCTMPSDNLTEKKKKELNGEVITYNVTRPMLWREYKALPDDLKREYWRNMQGCGATAAWLEDYMKVTNDTIISAAKSFGLPFKRGGGNRELWLAAEQRWNVQDAVELMPPHTEPEPAPVTPQEQNTEKKTAQLLHARLVMMGSRESILQHLALLVPDGVEIVVEW